MKEIQLAKKIIQVEEGCRLKPYRDTLGFPTIGWGELIGKKDEPLPDIEWTEEQCLEALDKHLDKAVQELSKSKNIKDVYKDMDDDRKAILISMWYQLGIVKLSGFSNTLKLLSAKDYEAAAKEMLDSVAAKQTPKRWNRQAQAMLSGDVISVYKFK